MTDRYLVTGGAGFIGSHLVATLVSAGHSVAVVDDFSTGRHENLRRFVGRVDVIEGSLVDPAVAARAVQGATYVLHQAGRPSVPRSLRDPAATHAANATGTLNLLVAARDAGVRRVGYASSSSVYGNTAELPKREDMTPRPLSPYAVSKLAGEQYCGAFHVSFGLETIALRYFNVFGPGQDPTSQYSAVIARFIAAALGGTQPTIYGDGLQTRDFTYVGNVVRANLLACTAPAAALGQAFNIGCGARVSVRELWERIKAVTGADAEPTFTATRDGDVHDSVAAIDRARTFLGYSPDIGLDAGLEQTVMHARQAGNAGELLAGTPLRGEA